MKLFGYYLAISLVVFCLCSGSCNKNSSNSDRDEAIVLSASSVASVGSEQFNSAALYDQAYYHNPLSAKRSDDLLDRVEAMAESELIWQKAVSEGYLEQPQVRRQVQQVVVTHFLRDQGVIRYLKLDEISAEDVEVYYKEHLSDYVVPTRVRIAHIQFAEPSAGKGGEEERALPPKQRASQMLGDPLLKSPGGFAKLARQRSEDLSSAVRAGDLGYLIVDGADQQPEWKTTLAKAAMELPRIGQIGNKVVKTSKGYHLIRMTGRRPGREYKLAEVDRSIRQTLSARSQQAAYQDFIDNLKKEIPVQINRELLQELAKHKPAGGSEAIRREIEEAQKSGHKKLVEGGEQKVEMKPVTVIQGASKTATPRGNFEVRVTSETKRSEIINPRISPVKNKSASESK